MINYLALVDYLPVILTVTTIAALLIGVPYQIQKMLCRLEMGCEYDV